MSPLVAQLPNRPPAGARGGNLTAPPRSCLLRVPTVADLRGVPDKRIVEQAGGAATTGRERILDLQPESLHQRVPVILGSKNEVERLERYHREYDAATGKTNQ